MDFVTHAPTATEQRWQATENRLPEFYSALADGTLLDNADTVGLAKEIIALHVVRSITRRAVHELVIERAHAGVVSDLLANPQALTIAFLRRTSLYPAGPQALQEQAEWDADRAVEALDSAAFWQERLMANIDELNSFMAPMSIQVFEVTNPSIEFLIADDPAPTLMAGFFGLGPLAGVTYENATTIAMPVSPNFAVALISNPDWQIATQETVHFLNRVQLSYADQRVFYNPTGSLRALAEVAPAARRARIGNAGPTLIDL
jgi:hypothetical protein